MLDIIKRFFSKVAEDNSATEDMKTEHDIRVATCALLVEIARIDKKFTQAEMDLVLAVLKELSNSTVSNVTALAAQADQRKLKYVLKRCLPVQRRYWRHL